MNGDWKLPTGKTEKNLDTHMPNNSNFSSTEGALKLRTNSPYSVMSRFSRSPPLQNRKAQYIRPIRNNQPIILAYYSIIDKNFAQF